MSYRVILYGSCLFLLLGLWESAAALEATDNPMRAPTRRQTGKVATAPTPPLEVPGAVFDVYLRFFQQVISPIDGARSNMYPTGSDYARQAIKKHGALVGIVLTADRLLHEGNEGRRAPRIRKYGLWRVYDPVAANDWWWQQPVWVYQPGQRSTAR